MILLFLSFTFLLAAYLPTRMPILFWIASSRNLGVSGESFYILSILSNFIVSALMITVFFKLVQMKDRLPRQTSGKFFMLIGIILTVVYMVVMSLLVITNNSLDMRVKYLSVVIWVTNIFLIVGIVKRLLPTKPLSSNS